MTITKERLLKIQHWRETYGADSNVMLPAEEAEELARIVLASLTAEPVFYIEVEGDDWTQAGRIPGSTFDFNNLPDGINKLYAPPPSPVADADPVVFTDERNLHHIARGRETSLIWGKQNQEVGDIPLYRHAQPVPVDKEFIPKNLDKALGVVGVALPESKEEFNFQIERWIQRLIDRVIRYADEFKEQLVPVVPEEMNFSTACNFVQINGMAKEDRATLAMRAWNACRAAMLQGGEPVSQTYELPQTQFEQVADLYEMQFDDGRTCAFHTDGAKAAQWLLACDDNKVQEYVRIERYQEAVIGNSPVSPGSWISCSERMPDNDESKPIAIFTGKCLGQGMFVATYDDDGFFDYWEGMEIIGVTHWMPLPEPPQEVNRG
ncbi:DUF551 domain-containing protein [Salmonella enterica]|nr:DUF551 domain-containing protein [Salmonella enterica]EEI2347523.1 DUF551 domain-containing protein [Salmonella enterica subsp. enterica serovar Singapore]EKK4184998.1 DUF551 domain-containing protein [Salmonella enterica]HBJ6755323.1 DUF551 domain-containing protein [Salmonella enterica subsp. enterica serovar Singapore]